MVLKIVYGCDSCKSTVYLSGNKINYIHDYESGGPVTFIVSNRNDTVPRDSDGVPMIQKSIDIAKKHEDDETVYLERGDIAYIMENGKTIDTIKVTK